MHPRKLKYLLKNDSLLKKKLSSLVLILICFVSNLTILSSQSIDHWETLVYQNDTWQYWLGNTSPDPAWNLPTFAATGWAEGQGGIGYGDDDDNTIITAVPSLFIRRTFEVIDKDKLLYGVLHADYDDAFVAYLNGIEIARANIAGQPPLFTDFSTTDHEAQLYNMGLPTAFSLSKEKIEACLQNGSNLLAIQIHNATPTSSDMSSNFFLSMGIEDETNDYGATPSWFFVPLLTSHLPIVKINTNGLTIIDEPDILADLGIIHNDLGLDNYVTDPFNEYAGKINIEIRGESSQTFDKKNYGIETTDENGIDMDTSFLGFPREEDWILHGPYSDKTLMRNVLSMHLARGMGQYASRTRFCELFINDDYKGVYVLMEKIKRDDDRVDLAKLTELDISGNELTGGYIFKIDKGEADWLSNFNAINTGNKIGFQHVYPRAENILAEQVNYIQSYVDSFERAVAHPNYHFGGKRYNEYIDINSFAENFLFNELTKNIDAYRISSYYYKKKDSKGGKMYAGPVWDYNLAWHNADFCDGASYQGWHYYLYCGNQAFWWNRFFQDPIFVNVMRCRWEELREGPFHKDTIFAFIDEQVALIGDAADRNFERWPILGNYVWPNPAPYPQTYAEEIQVMKNWIINRLSWMDQNVPGQCVPVSTEEELLLQFEMFPNPTRDVLHVNFSSLQNFSILKIINNNAHVVDSFEITNKQALEISTQDLPQGIYYLQLINEQQSVLQKFVKL